MKKTSTTASQKFQSHFLQQVGDLTELLQALERLPDAMFMIKNLESRYIYISRATRQVLNLRPDEDGVGLSDFDLFPKIFAESFRQNDLQVFNHGRVLVNEVHAGGLFGHPINWCFSSKFPLHDRQGNIIGLVIINEMYNKVLGQDAELNRLLPAIEHMMQHYSETITVADLARLCHFSESHFMRVFKEQMKMTAYAFVEQVRMFHATDALKHGASSMTEIALKCGYYDHSAFVKRFKKFTGTTPLRYRRDQQAKLQTDRAIALPEPTV